VDRFGWIADGHDLPPQWDLRRCGWTMVTNQDLAAERAGAAAILLDARRIGQDEAAALLLDGTAPLRHTVVLGIEDSAERAALLELGCGEVLPPVIELPELAARSRRLVESADALPRLRRVGPLLLDLIHRDARRGPAWLGLHPREFTLLWRLADEPGERVTRRMLLTDVWRLQHEPETNSVEVHVSRLRGKLALAGCADLVRTVPTGGYRLDAAAQVVPAPCGPLPFDRSLPRPAVAATLQPDLQDQQDEC